MPSFKILNNFLSKDQIDYLLSIERFIDRDEYIKSEYSSGQSDYGKYIISENDNLDVSDSFDNIVLKCIVELKETPLHWDCQFIRFAKHSMIIPHVDRSDPQYAKQKLLNVTLIDGKGGKFIIDGEVADTVPGDAVIFSPDSVRHEMSETLDERLIFSVGILYE